MLMRFANRLVEYCERKQRVKDMVYKNHTLLLCLPPQSPRSNQEKNIRQILIERHPTIYLTMTLQNCQLSKNKASLRNRHSQEEQEKAGQVNTL